MTDLFLKILNLSFSATWVVLGVVVARLLLKKAPRRMICLLWALVALRLIFGGIEAPFSLIPSTELIPPESLFDQTPTIQSGVSSIDELVNPVYSESLRPSPGASANPLQIWLAVFSNLWLLGMGAMALWAAVCCLRVRRQVREAIPSGEVWLCDRISSPFIFGLFRPRIYLPSDLGEVERAHVVAHERSHLRRRDHWWKPLGFVLLAVNWFNPALWLAYILLCRDIELACDEQVIRNYSHEEKKAYSAALLNCSVNSRQISACPLAFGEVGVKQRIKSVLSYKKPTFWIILVAVILSVVLAFGLLTNPSDRTSELRYDGRLYVLTNTLESYLPSTGQVGDLHSILHRTNQHPNQELQATNLDESLAGCPIYPDGDNLYVLKYDGSALCFEPIPSELKTFTIDDISLQVELPGGWEAESFYGNGYAGFRFRFENYTEDGWITVKYWPNRVTRLYWPGESRENTFPSGLTATVFYDTVSEEHDPDEWETVWFYDDSECMSVEKPENYLWDGNYLKDTFSVIGTIRVFEDGEAKFTAAPSTTEYPYLGISLRLENITANGATLICSQDGTPWDEIITGAPWNLEQHTEDGWVSVMPESTVWTTIAYGLKSGEEARWNLNWRLLAGTLDPGLYRVSKTFTGRRNPPFTLGIEGDEYTQTCYAEFIIDPSETKLFSAELYQALEDDWLAFEALSDLEKAYSSHMPGSCAREFDDWSEVERFVGMELAHPFEDLDTLEPGNWAAAPVGYNGGSRYRVTGYGTREGTVQWVHIQSGYRRDGLRVTATAKIEPGNPVGSTDPVITTDSGEEYEARTAELTRGGVQYTIRVMGDPGTADALTALLGELLPYYETIPA